METDKSWTSVEAAAYRRHLDIDQLLHEQDSDAGGNLRPLVLSRGGILTIQQHVHPVVIPFPFPRGSNDVAFGPLDR